MRSLLPDTGLMLALIFGPGLAHAAGTPLPLRAGTYVVAGYKPCKEAPLAGVTSFDGTSFQGPHASNCQTIVLERHGAKYRVKTACMSLGDGSPAVTDDIVQVIRIKSSSSFVVTHGRKNIEYGLYLAFH